MQLVRVKSLTSVEARTTRLQSVLPLSVRPAIGPIHSDGEAPASDEWTHSPCAPEHRPALDRTTALAPIHIPAGREARGPTEIHCVNGEIKIVVRWDCSPAFICEIRGKPGLNSANAKPPSSPVAWRDSAPTVRRPRRTAILRTDPREMDPF
jgi:hypothetical protein